MIKNLKQKLQFIELMDKMKDIDRTIFLRNGKQENDAEHSFHLAMIVITFAEDFPELNIEKCLKLALIHDIIEIYAWDTPVHDKEFAKSKKQREYDSLKRLEKEFWKVLPEFIALAKEYEEMKTSEAQFVTSVDKIHPIMQVALEWGKAWRDYKIDFDMIKKRQYSKIYPQFGFDKILDIYFEKAEKEGMWYRE